MTQHVKQFTFYVSILIILLIASYFIPSFGIRVKKNQPINPVEIVKSTEKVHHIFFHSLIIYPEMLHGNPNEESINMYMVTKDKFKEILNNLYKNNFILINTDLLYEYNEKDHSIKKKDLYLPKGKKPLVISIDDPAYPVRLYGAGFANKMIYKDGHFKTIVKEPGGKFIETNDGDVIPIVEDFVEKHPDFSWKGAKGIVAMTGFEGNFGYRTEPTSSTTASEKEELLPIINELKNHGWVMASHSFSHMMPFRLGQIDINTLAWDIDMWNKEVRPMVGESHIFIGPFGQIFHEGDPRRELLVKAGFHELYGVGMDEFEEYNSRYYSENRIDIDGFRLKNNKEQLSRILGI